MSRLALAAASTALFLGTGCAHKQLAFSHTKEEALHAPRQTGVGAWIAQNDDAIKVGAAVKVFDAEKEVGAEFGKGKGSIVGAATTVVSWAGRFASLLDFQQAVNGDGTRTSAREVGPGVLSVHTRPDAVAVHFSPELP